MMETYEIKNLEQILESHLGPYKNIVSYEATPLTSGGENFGSLMLRLDVIVRNTRTNKEEAIHAVAKMLPPNEMVKEVFNVNVTFRKEVNVYTVIIKEMQMFAKEQGFKKDLDIVPEYYGSRSSLDPNAPTVDNDAVLILENLKHAGYIVVDRLIGFDLATAKLILEQLALFHGVSLAYKLLKPKTFQRILMPHLGPGMDSLKGKDMHDQTCKDQIETAASLNNRCAELKDTIFKVFSASYGIFESNCTFNDPYGTVCHLDLWVNNILLKYIDGKPIKSKFVDFQVLCYANLARDIVFFLFTSVQFPILKQYYNELVQAYHKVFYDTLHSLDCNMKEYSLERLHEEIERVAKSTEMAHAVRWLMPILAERGTVPDISEIDFESMIGLKGTDKYEKRLVDTLLMFDSKGWF